MTQRTVLKPLTKQLGYRDLQMLVAERKTQCSQDKLTIKEEIKATKTAIKHQLSRPSNLGIAFLTGFAADTLKTTRASIAKQNDSNHDQHCSIISTKLVDIVVTALIKNYYYNLHSDDST
ncbi:hypothetical protein [Reinekea sp.]|jgi:hypothetical protein|uniref:hypothetical protein n=1 Tax=Reinekea sp. TaxID=1970455 RepID=UPI00398A29E2